MLKFYRMKKIVFLILIASNFITAQELFVMTEPASNMPAGSVGVRLQQSLMKRNSEGGYNFHQMPELMWGTNKNLMLHAAAFLSTKNQNYEYDGVGAYAKYRFFSVDDLHKHFRMAVFGRIGLNFAKIDQEEIETMGQNSGFEFGFIGTQLVNKTAISSSLSYERSLDRKINLENTAFKNNDAVNYTLSVGQLIYPKKYVDFKQTNINLMLEFLGQTLTDSKKSYLDVVPSVQFIINSQARIDFAYRKEIYSSIQRMASNGIYLKLEYTFFNVSN
jgi:hypothetical protein